VTTRQNSSSDASLLLEVPAKINFWLEVLNRRPDGYHNVSSLMLPIGIHDRVTAARRERGIELGGDGGGVPLDRNNLAWRAAEIFLGARPDLGGVRLELTKRIPVAAGLGGGSADAAAVLLLLNRLAEPPLSLPDLARLAVQLGADVPFFLRRCPALATGIGEILEPIHGLPPYPLVLIKAPVAVATALVYSRLKLTRGGARTRIATLLAHPWEPRRHLVNDLEAVTLEMHLRLKQIKAWLYRRGALGVLMSGSGPTVFAVYRTLPEARAIGSEADNEWPECWVGVTEVLASPSTGVGR